MVLSSPLMAVIVLFNFYFNLLFRPWLGSGPKLDCLLTWMAPFKRADIRICFIAQGAALNAHGCPLYTRHAVRSTCNMLRQSVPGRAVAQPALGGVLTPLRAPVRPFSTDSGTHRQAVRTQQRTRYNVQTAASATAQEAAPAGSDAPTTSELLAPQMTWPSRSHCCGTLRASDASTKVTICGWVDRNRDLGGVQFVDVRDHTGLLQVDNSSIAA